MIAATIKIRQTRGMTLPSFMNHKFCLSSFYSTSSTALVTMTAEFSDAVSIADVLLLCPNALLLVVEVVI